MNDDPPDIFTLMDAAPHAISFAKFVDQCGGDVEVAKAVLRTKGRELQEQIDREQAAEEQRLAREATERAAEEERRAQFAAAKADFERRWAEQWAEIQAEIEVLKALPTDGPRH